MNQIPRYRLVFFTCFVLSSGGIFLAIFYTKKPLDGSRGGVLAVGFALISILVKKDVASKVYEALQKDPAKRATNSDEKLDNHAEIGRLKLKLADMEKSFIRKSAEDRTMNNYLVAATALGTLVAAFGDVLCEWVICQCDLHRLWCR